MESFGLAGALWIASGAILGAVQLFYAYTLQVMADKQLQPGWVRFLAWIPLFNVYTFIRCGGGRMGRLLLGCLAIGIALAGAFAVGPILENEILSLALVWLVSCVAGVCLLIYLGRIFWRMAERADLEGYVGLLCMIPLVNLWAFPHLALHDGWRRPNWAGLAAALLLFASPVAIRLQMPELIDAIDPTPLLRAHLDPDSEGVRIERRRVAAVPEIEENLQTMGAMVEQSADLAQASDGAAATGDPDDAGRPAPPAGIDGSSSDSPSVAGVGGHPCPPGTAPQGSAPPAGREQWCAHVGANSGVRHGWYVEWHSNGRPATAGQYHDGARVGTWTRWYPDGTPRAEADFVDGMQHGTMVAYDEDGRVVRELEFREGEVVVR